MLTKSDTKIIKDLLQPFATKDDLKNFVTKDDLKPLKNDIAKIRRDTSTIADFFDKEYLDLRKRVERIEEHLQLLDFGFVVRASSETGYLQIPFRPITLA